MAELIRLWQDAAPYTEFSPEQNQPTLKPFIVEGSRGAVIVLAGGGYAHKAPHEADPIAEMINKAGVSAFVLDYRIFPCHKMAPLSDANRAVRMVRSMGYEKVSILGFSAGGNLCCCAATHYDNGNPDAEDPIEHFSSRPDSFIPCYAVVSFIGRTHKGTVGNLLGADADDEEWLRYFSAELNVTDDTPEAFIWHTAEDGAVPVSNSLNLASALSAHGIPFEIHVFPEGRHGLGLAESVPHVAQWAGLLQKWLIMRGYDNK